MDFCFYLITDRNAPAGGFSLEYVLEQAFEAGVRGLLLREKDLPDAELIELARKMRAITARHGVRLMISGRADIAVNVGADGVHLTSGAPDVSAARMALGPDKYVAVSTHSLVEAQRAEYEGVDFITFGPVYHTASKASFGPPVGLVELERVCRGVNIPVFALGGIKEENALAAMQAGAFGLAAISAVIGAGEPGRAAVGIIDKIRSHKLRKLI